VGKSTDPSQLSSEHLDAIQIDLLRREFSRGINGQANELGSLRTFNSQLLERIGEFRRRNLELSNSESALRSALTSAESLKSEYEKDLKTKSDENQALKAALAEQKRAFDRYKDEMGRKLAKLTDEKWAMEIERDGLKTAISERDELLANAQGDTAKAVEETQRAHRLEIESMQSANEILSSQTEQMATEIAQMQSHASDLKRLHGEREAQLVAAFDNLRSEYSNIDTCYKESSEHINRLRADLESVTRTNAGMQAQLNVSAQEIRKLRQSLEVRDIGVDAERTRLQTWQERLEFLDQYLRQLSETMKRDKNDVLRLARSMAQELESSRGQPFRDYLPAVENELTHLQTQLQNTSELSPMRLKLEVRLAQTREHKDALLAIFAEADRRTDERVRALQAIVKNATSANLG
jgi:chromosome segregation ATPase